MFLVRPLPPTTRAGRRSAGRRFLLIETKRSTVPYVRPRFGQRRYVFDDIPLVTRPIAMLCAPARIEWDDCEFRAVRKTVASYQAKARCHDQAADDAKAQARFVTRMAFAECEAIAHQIFTPEPETIRDVFLRAEVLTMHYGDDRLGDLLDSECPADRLLGGLLEACWKVGGAANV